MTSALAVEAHAARAPIGGFDPESGAAFDENVIFHSDYGFSGTIEPAPVRPRTDGYGPFTGRVSLYNYLTDQDPSANRASFPGAVEFIGGSGPSSYFGSHYGDMTVVRNGNYDTISLTGPIRPESNDPSMTGQYAFTFNADHMGLPMTTFPTLGQPLNGLPSLGHIITSGTYSYQWANLLRTVESHGQITSVLASVPLPPSVLLFGAGLASLLALQLRRRVLPLFRKDAYAHALS
jgi:hypothetical protein